MKHDRLLQLILAGLGILVVVTLVLFFTRRDDQAYGAEDTPQGVVRNYILALQQGDYQKAYDYLGGIDSKPTFDEFQANMITMKPETLRIFVQIGEADQSGSAAAVTLTINHAGSGPFENGWDENSRIQLTQNESGSWKITAVPYPFWHPSWTDIKPIPP